MTDANLYEEVRTAFSDSVEQRDNYNYSHEDRCLSFLTSDWFDSAAAAREALESIGPYNAFDPETAGDILEAIVRDADPDARFAVGREGSPAIYVETDDAEAVRAVFDRRWTNDDADAPWQRAGPDELAVLDDPRAVGSARKYETIGPDLEPHNMCQHDEPPVDTENLAPVSDDREYVRAWWD